ncbi:MAG: hypothetical protein ACTHN5_19300 [Phycisphaerae bacterium]
MHRLTAAATLLFLALAARADIVLRTDSTANEGKILQSTPTDLILQSPNALPITIPKSQIARIIPTDDHGKVLTPSPRPLPSPPPEPAAPPLPASPPAGNTYYLIPLHGEVGVTILASALDKSLADAEQRHPTVVLLDIRSPGGLVEEATKILKVLHAYNPRLRIVALTDQDLSAAAVITLSVKEIYVRPGSTIGAAVPYAPSNLFLPPKLEEKFTSAWRAVARNSAEEGGHEPLLADAMIDNSFDLHIETLDNKPVVKEGPERPNSSDIPLLRKGKILTLSAKEAVASGLAAGEAENLDDLARQLHLAPWTECPGLAVPLANYIPQRAALFKTELDKIAADLAINLNQAQQTDPTHSIHFTITAPKGAPQPPKPPAPPPPEDPITERLHWKQHTLACVLALQSAEQNLHDAITLSTTFGHESAAEPLTRLLAKVSQVRAALFDIRNRFGEGAPPTTPATAKPLPSPDLPITTAAQAQSALTSPNPDDQSRAARFLATAPVDPARREAIENLLLPFLQGTDSIKNYVFMEAFAHWAGKDDSRVLAAILASPPATPANPNPQNRYWPAAITALVRVDPAAAEPILQQRRAEFYFRSKVTYALQSLIDANAPEKPAAQHLLTLLRPKSIPPHPPGA